MIPERTGTRFPSPRCQLASDTECVSIHDGGGRTLDERDRIDERADMPAHDARGEAMPPVAAVPGPLNRWGPASYWRLGLVALLGLMIVILALGGGFWTAEPIDTPR